MSIPVIQDPMLEKLKRIDAKNTQQKIIDGLRGTGPGVKKPPATLPKNIMANSPRFGGMNVGGIIGNLKGGIVDLTLGSLANMVIPHISRETVRGALVLTGQDTTNFDRRNAGLPVVANLDGVSYNISTEEGLQGALKAKNKGAKPSKPNTIQRFADIRGSITPGSMQPAATNLGEGASMDAAERFRAGAGFPAGVTRPDDYPTLFKTPENSGLNDRGPSAAELFNKYKQQGLDEKTARKKAEDEGMRIWANKYKNTLAKKVKEGQAGYSVIQDTLYPNTEEGFANPNRPGVVEMIDGQKLQEPMSINQLNAVLDVRDFNMKPTSVMSVLAQKDPQKALNEFMTANNLVGDFTTASEPIVGSFPQKEYPLMTENYFGFGEYPLMTENYFGFGKK